MNIIAWIDIIGEGVGDKWHPLDVGILVSKTALENFEVLGYGGWTVEHPEYDLYKDNYPSIALVNDALPPQSIDKVDVNMETFLSTYLNDNPNVVMAHRCGVYAVAKHLPKTYAHMNEEFPIERIASVMDFLGIPSGYRYPDIFPEDFPDRAVGRALYHHAEAQVYGNNIKAWGNDSLQNMVDELMGAASTE